MASVSGFKPLPFDVLFGSVDNTVSQEIWENAQQSTAPVKQEAQPESQKRRQKMNTLKAVKKAKMTLDDDSITDETAKKAAKELLDQIETTPGQISLDLSSSKAIAVCPLTPSLNQHLKSHWTIDQLREGQLSNLLASTDNKFQSLGSAKIHKSEIKTELLPRQMNLKDTINNLKKADKSGDQYVGFAVAVVNILRRCDSETAGRLVQSISAVVESEASNIINMV